MPKSKWFVCPHTPDLERGARLNLVSKFKPTVKQDGLISYSTYPHGYCKYIFNYNNNASYK